MPHTKAFFRVTIVLAAMAGLSMLVGCSRADHEADRYQVWLGFTLREPRLTPGYPEFSTSRAEATARVRRRNDDELADAEAEFERRFLLAMADLLDGQLMAALLAFDHLEREGYSRARLLSRLTLLQAQTSGNAVRDLIQFALANHRDEHYVLNEAELLNIVKADARRVTPIATLVPAFVDASNMPQGVAETNWYQQGLEARESVSYVGRSIDEALWSRRGIERPDLGVINLTDDQVRQIDDLPNRMDAWLVKLLVFSHPFRFAEDRLLHYLPIGPDLLAIEGDQYNDGWMARIVSEALVAAPSTPHSLADDLLEAFEIRDHRSGMLDLAVIEARLKNNAGAADIVVELIDSAIVHGIDEQPGVEADAKPDLVFLLSAVYVIYPDFDQLIDSEFGAEIEAAFERALERTNWHIVR